tara:strand:+ start:717 stop:983 length:267 start_codon:yes stop_codon:yes gene_type:complete
MIKNILSILVFLLSIFFFYFIVNTYFSNDQKIKIQKNRISILQKIKNKTSNLTILDNDTINSIIFNSGFENENSKIERNFWKLFKKND